ALRQARRDLARVALHAPVAVEAEPQQVEVLGDHLRARPREVEGERRHVVTEVVDPEDQVLGGASGARHTIQPTPGYTSPYLWPDVLIDATRGSRKSHSSSGSIKGATNAPDAPSTCTGTSRPVRSCRSSSAAQMSATGSYEPSKVEPRIATTPIVFSSQSFMASSAERW